MSTLEEKLEHFNEVILKDAAWERDKILKLARDEVDKMIEEKKQGFHMKADETLKKEITQADKEKNITISEAFTEGRRLLMETRDNIIDSVINYVKQLLEQFVMQDSYLDYLKEEIKKSWMQAGEGERVLYLNRRDIDRFSKNLEDLRKELLSDIQIIEANTDIIGGCKVLNKSKGIVIDNTFLKKLEMNRDIFLEGK